MTPDLLHDVGEALFGPRWQSDLARQLDMSDRHMRRLASGQAEVTTGMIEDILAICERRTDRLSGLIERLRKETGRQAQ